MKMKEAVDRVMLAMGAFPFVSFMFILFILSPRTAERLTRRLGMTG